MATPDQIRTALETKASQFSTTWPIYYNNEDVDVNNIVKFYRVSVQFASAFRETMTGVSTSGQKITGFVVIQSFVKQGTGTGTQAIDAGLFKEHMNEKRLTITSSRAVDLHCPEIITIGDDGNGFYQINIRCPFTHIT